MSLLKHSQHKITNNNVFRVAANAAIASIPSVARMAKSISAICCILFCIMRNVYAIVYFPRGGSMGYLAAVAMPLDLPDQNVYMAFNFEANYGLPSNDSYNEWIQRWNYTNEFLGIGNNVMNVNGRRRSHRSTVGFTRTNFYRTITNYLNHFEMNGTACLLRLICEVTESEIGETSGVFGNIIQILFMPTTSAPEPDLYRNELIYKAEYNGYRGNCKKYARFCPEPVMDLFTQFF